MCSALESLAGKGSLQTIQQFSLPPPQTCPRNTQEAGIRDLPAFGCHCGAVL